MIDIKVELTPEALAELLNQGIYRSRRGDTVLTIEVSGR